MVFLLEYIKLIFVFFSGKGDDEVDRASVSISCVVSTYNWSSICYISCKAHVKKYIDFIFARVSK